MIGFPITYVLMKCGSVQKQWRNNITSSLKASMAKREGERVQAATVVQRWTIPNAGCLKVNGRQGVVGFVVHYYTGRI